MLNAFINNYYLENKRILKTKFIKAKPFPYLVLKKFFKDELINNLAKELKKENFQTQE